VNHLISIIIPCYNHGEYLEETIQSIEAIKGSSEIEILIMNDGSTKVDTITELKRLESSGYNVIHQANQGLAAARNNAINLAKGKYILPLDADNKLHANYLTKAVDILNKNENIDIVYGNRILFGEESGLKKPGAFDFNKIVIGNYIDACALYRKSVWEENGGYDGKMPAMGHEDWEFWIHACLNNKNFYYLDDICFYYRTSGTSMNITTSMPNAERNKQYIYCKHGTKIIEKFYTQIQNLEYIRKYKLKAIVKLLLGYKF
jgi:glycosyltransferase involved in cell wall biosynthesis